MSHNMPALDHSQIPEALRMANHHLAAGQIQQADFICQQVLAADPQSVEARYMAGIIALQAEQPATALSLIEPVIAQHPDHAPALSLFAVALCESGRAAESLEIFTKLLARDPNDANNLSNYAKALSRNKQFDQAIEAASKAAALQPQWNEPYLHLAHALHSTARVTEAIDAYRRTLALNPGWDRVHRSVLFLIHFDPASDLRSIYAEHARWNTANALQFQNRTQVFTNNRKPDRRLRLGYFSADFRDHCQALYTIPLVSNHDRDAFELFFYADVAMPDPITQRIRGLAGCWRNTHGLTDARLAEMILSDRIDVLVDLTMHMKGGRPLLFARKPAPVQVAWLAYPSTTGLTAIDYRLTDPYLDPPGMNDEFYSERSYRLPHTFWCYDALSEEPPVNDLPADKNGFITFGCLNSFTKANSTVLKMWAPIFRELPQSRLLMMAPEGSSRQRVIDGLGIDPSRAEFVDRQLHSQYLATYHRIDLCLDTFPYNGHTTSMDAMWMGVPVVNRRGQTAVSRAGFSQASNLGLTELIADTPEQFVKIAVDLANDLPRLRKLRAALREKIRVSPLMDTRQFARDIEQAYRTMWRRWCKNGGATTIGG